MTLAPDRSLQRHRVPLLLLTLAAATYWVWFRVSTNMTLEDSWITYRYAGNLARGEGLVFNPGEYVLGITTPLLALLLGGLGAVFGAGWIPLISNVLMISAGLVTGLLIHRILQRAGFYGPVLLLAPAVYFFHPEIVWTSTGGMETPLVLLLMAASLSWVQGEKYRLATLAAALLVIARVDGVFWASLIFAWTLARTRRSFVSTCIPALLVLTAWVLFATWYFGSPIPHSVTAKRAIGFAGGSQISLDELMNDASWFYKGLIGVSLHRRPIDPTLLKVWVPFVFLGIVKVLRDHRRTPLCLLLALPPILFAAYFFGRAPRYFFWYLTPVTWCSLIVGTIGVHQFGVLLASRTQSRRLPQIAVASVALVVLVLLAITGGASAVSHRNMQRNEDSLRRSIGLWLAENSAPEATVAMEAIGCQGYFSQRRVIDLAGLVSPAVVSIGENSRHNAEAFSKILRILKPDYLVLRTVEVDRNIHFHGGRMFYKSHRRFFIDHYEEAKRFVAERPSYWAKEEWAYLTVFKLRGAAEGSLGR